MAQTSPSPLPCMSTNTKTNNSLLCPAAAFFRSCFADWPHLGALQHTNNTCQLQSHDCECLYGHEWALSAGTQDQVCVQHGLLLCDCASACHSICVACLGQQPTGGMQHACMPHFAGAAVVAMLLHGRPCACLCVRWGRGVGYMLGTMYHKSDVCCTLSLHLPPPQLGDGAEEGGAGLRADRQIGARGNQLRPLLLCVRAAFRGSFV
jgi:hypothetical protein